MVADGGLRPFTCSATALRKEGKTSGAVFCVYDETDPKRSERRLSVQYKVARIAMEAQDFQAAATSILKSIVCDLDWAFGSLWILEESGQHLVRAAHWPPEASHGLDPRRLFPPLAGGGSSRSARRLQLPSDQNALLRQYKFSGSGLRLLYNWWFFSRLTEFVLVICGSGVRKELRPGCVLRLLRHKEGLPNLWIQLV